MTATQQRQAIANVKRASDRARRFPTYTALVAAHLDGTPASAIRVEVALVRVRAMLGIEV